MLVIPSGQLYKLLPVKTEHDKNRKHKDINFWQRELSPPIPDSFSATQELLVTQMQIYSLWQTLTKIYQQRKSRGCSILQCNNTVCILKLKTLTQSEPTL